MNSTIGVSAQDHGLRMVMPAFHGHAHNRACQLSFHILMSPGFGLEDLETCERVFAGSNAVARLTRHATPFHRWQFIDMHFQQWDKDKYVNLGKCFLWSLLLTADISLGEFLLNNYKQALDILREMPIRIATLLSGGHVSDVQFAGWLEVEHRYLKSKQAEPQADILRMEYVELLTKYNDAQWAFVSLSLI